jgi:hypothetical protein
MSTYEHLPSATVPGPLSWCLGYAGPRRLGSRDDSGVEWERQLRTALEIVAREIRARLSPERPLCLVGALAQGADLAIAETMLAHGAVLRAFLPEPIDRFANETDFPKERDRERLAVLARHERLTEVRVVSSANDRRERFFECATEIVRAADAMLCVRHFDAESGRGGTEEAVSLARAMGRPIIDVRLERDPAADAQIVFPPELARRADARPLPFPTPDPRATVAAWKATASAEAGRSKHLIVRAAAWTVGLQLAATLIAVLTHGREEWEVPSLVAKLVVILTAGGIAAWASRRRVNTRWAGRRFAAELQRSWSAVRGLRGPANWLEDDLPSEFASHGRDLALLHGLDRAQDRTDDLPGFKTRYAAERLAGQRDYASRTARSARSGRRTLNTIFYACIAATLVAVLTKLGLRAFGAAEHWSALDRACSLVSILGPAFGAAAVSFVALLDLSARTATQSRLADFLDEKERLLST